MSTKSITGIKKSIINVPDSIWKKIFTVLPFVIFGLLWELLSGTIISARVLPSLSSVVMGMVELWTEDGRVQSYLGITVYRGLSGVAISTLIGVPLGILTARHVFIEKNVTPMLDAFFPLPKSPMIPIVIFWFGIGNLSRIILAVISSLIPITLSSISGTKNVDENLIWSAKSMGLSDTQVLYKVILPAALPTILSGIRIGTVFSFITIISSEMIIARDGIGVLVTQFASQGRYDLFFASVLFIAILVGSINRLFLLFSNRLVSWSEEGVSGV